MKKKLIYTIGIATIALSSCSDDRNDTPGFLNGNEKTPIVVVTNLQANTLVTRAVNAEFEENDLLNAYIKHVTVTDANANPLVYSADVTGTGVGPRLANFKISGLTDDHKNEADNWTNHSVTSTLTVTDATGLYWDDFSNSASASTDLRTEKHALQVYYGYGYNGGTASTSLTETTGTLGWTVATDQSNGFKTSDLLYAGTQVPVAYVHGTNNTINGRDKVLTVPYSHAMSKVTVEVICADGFNPEVDNFANASVKLKSMNTAATVTAPSQNLSSYSASEDITTFGTANITNPKTRKSFSALIAPTVMKADMVLAEIIGVDGNNYEIKLTDAVIDAKDSDGTTTLTNAWSTQLATAGATEVTPATQADYNATNGGLTKPGVHYMITVTIKKQEIKVSATIQNWVAVSATGIGDIMFDSDVKDVPDGIADDLKSNGFDLYKSENSIFGTKATTVSWDGSSWVYTPKIYWESSSDAEYFRALSGAYADDAATVSVNESLAMVQDRDVLWATTPAHSGTDVNGNNYNYAKSDKINPRTGNVPLEFEHAMTNISVELKTPAGLTEVDLTNARIDIINTYNKGIIDLYSGDISDFELDLTAPAVYTLSEMVNSDHKMLNKVVIPQSLVNDKDGATRDDSPTFYQSGELNRIYDDGTFLPAGGGTGTYYLTSELVAVPDEFYDEAGANAYNATLDGARLAGYEVKYSEEEVLAHNAQLDGAVSAGNPKPSPGTYTAPEAIDHNSELDGAVSTATTKHVYSAEDAIIYNSTLSGHRDAGYVVSYYTAADAALYNANLTGAVHENDPKPSTGNYTAQEAIDYNAQLPGAVSTSTPKETYTADDAAAYNALLPGARTAGYEVKYTAEEAATYNANLPGAVHENEPKPSPGPYSADEAAEYNATLLGAVTTSTTKHTYDADDANAYNATLTGAVKDGDLKLEAHYVLPESKTPATTSLTSHTSGELKTVGDKIMMYITLKNGTRYKLELSKCKDSNGDLITEWKRGKHYTYEITLGKEEIKFRALIKDWDVTTGSGNATIDWD